jgi:hypothetical protein
MLTKEEINEMLQLLERAGWEPLLCDTPVQCYDVQVSAGTPNGVGDPIRLDDMVLPKELARIETCCSVRVKGDSMKDAGILNGDRVQFRMDGIYSDGDIVVASIDNELTLKTYYKDEDGNHWLVPLNEAYSPILLQEDMNVKILGSVELLTRQSLRPSHAYLERIMRNAREKGEALAPQKTTPQDIILFAAPMIEVAKHWYSVYRALVDMSMIEDGMIVSFVEMVKQTVPNHPLPPTVDALRRARCMSFSKPVRLWRADNAPVTGARFEKYLRIAQACLEKGKC